MKYGFQREGLKVKNPFSTGKGKLTGYGFYELHHQIKSLNKINKLKIEIHAVNNMIYNELKLSLLRNNYEIKICQ